MAASTAGWNNDAAGSGLGAMSASAVDVDGRGSILAVHARRQRRSSRVSHRRLCRRGRSRVRHGRGRVRSGRVGNSRGGMAVFLNVAGVGRASREGEKSNDGSREVHFVVVLCLSFVSEADR